LARPTPRRSRTGGRRGAIQIALEGVGTLVGLGALLAVVGCGQTLDVGRDRSHTELPVDERNPLILSNDDWSDNWSGEYAMLLANSGGPELVDLVIGGPGYDKDKDLASNVAGWNDMVTAARSSGLKGVPDVTAGAATQLQPPADGLIESTVPIGSAGAKLIVDVSRKLSLPWRPVVVAACAQLTDIADAYLLDPTVVDRVVVVALLGHSEDQKGLMTGPNGDLDPWADWIVAQRFQYVQISATYEQLKNDVTADSVADLPDNEFGRWMRAKQPSLSGLANAADQVAVLAVALQQFAGTAQRVSTDTSAGFNTPPGQGPPLVPDADGNAWLVTKIDDAAQPRLWEMLKDPRTWGS
jgi:hypothetical protein